MLSICPRREIKMGIFRFNWLSSESDGSAVLPAIVDNNVAYNNLVKIIIFFPYHILHQMADA